MRIVITGASGFFAWELIRQLKNDGRYSVAAVSSDVERAEKILGYEDIEYFTNSQLLSGEASLSAEDVVVHTAFCRQSAGDQLARSMDFSLDVFEKAVSAGVKGIINLSSQSVYGGKKEELPDEGGRLDPDYLYALAKSASEIILKSAAKGGKTKYTNLRTASLMGVSRFVPESVLYKFAVNALEGRDISIVGGKQKFSFLDVRDAAKATILLTDRIDSGWDTAYNMGPLSQTGIVEMAELVVDAAAEITGKRVNIDLTPQDIVLNSGMDSRKLYSKLGWKPEYSFEQTVRDTVRYATVKNKIIQE